MGGVPVGPKDVQAGMGALVIRQLLEASGMGRALGQGSPMVQGMFLEALAEEVAKSTPLMPEPPSGAHVRALVDEGRVSSAFGPRADPLTGAPSFHQGLDVAAPRGTPVHAFADGYVSHVGENDGYGLMVEVSHAGGMRTRYAHLGAAAVAPGSPVKRGEILGEVGETGRTTGPHLHFEVRQGGVGKDPTVALKAYAGVSNDRLPAKGLAARRAP